MPDKAPAFQRSTGVMGPPTAACGRELGAGAAQHLPTQPRVKLWNPGLQGGRTQRHIQGPHPWGCSWVLPRLPPDTCHRNLRGLGEMLSNSQSGFLEMLTFPFASYLYLNHNQPTQSDSPFLGGLPGNGCRQLVPWRLDSCSGFLWQL